MNYNEIYNHSYFFKDSDNLSYRENRLRFGDQFSAICYTFGIHFLDVFQYFKDLTPRDFCWELAYPDNKGFRQFELIKQLVDIGRYLRTPTSIIEIGSGRGEITAFLNYVKLHISMFDYELQSLDVAPEFEQMYNDTCNRLFECNLPLNLTTGTLKEKYKDLNYINVDTVIMSEVIEHLSEEEFWEFFNHALPYFRKNNTRLIIVNSWGYWPIETSEPDHIWKINDQVYDNIQSFARSVIVRSSSHLVIEF
jgi:hypothetical protein